jgi:hypothetical protein
MENKSATKGTGHNKEGCSKKKGADAIRGRLKEKGSDHNKGRGRTEGGGKQKGTDPKISPCKKYVVMITAA